LRAQFPDYPIKKIRLDNASEFTSKAFDDYCMSIRIDVEHPVAHTHTQNGLAESFIKRLQMIARPLLLKTKLPVSAWGHAILHAALLVRIRPTAYRKYSPLQLVLGQ
jgi:transposase InsO family protein